MQYVPDLWLIVQHIGTGDRPAIWHRVLLIDAENALILNREGWVELRSHRQDLEHVRVHHDPAGTEGRGVWPFA